MIDTKWKAFIELTTENGKVFLDVNRPVMLTTYSTEGSVPCTIVHTPEAEVTVVESPEQICKLVDEKIEAQIAKIAKEKQADHEAMLEFHAQQEAERNKYAKGNANG